MLLSNSKVLLSVKYLYCSTFVFTLVLLTFVTRKTLTDNVISTSIKQDEKCRGKHNCRITLGTACNIQSRVHKFYTVQVSLGFLFGKLENNNMETAETDHTQTKYFKHLLHRDMLFI
jgi:hypothetical protein